MALIFDFFFPDGFLYWSWLQWLFYILLILAYIFLALGSNSLKNDNYNSTKLTLITGLLLLIWFLAELLIIPTVSGSSPTDLERLLGYTYSLFLMTGIIYSTLHGILGVGFIKIGSDNRDKGGTVILVGGILYLLTWIINSIIVILTKTGGWFGFPVPIGFILDILTWITYIVVIVATILIFIFSIIAKRALFIIFGVLYLAVYSIQFLVFIGVF